MRYQPRHRSVTTTSRLLSPPVLATATLVAGATTAAAAGRVGSETPTTTQAESVRRTHAVASRSVARPVVSAGAHLPSRSVARLLTPVTVPAGLTQAAAFDAAGTRAARAQLATTQQAYDRSRAALVAARAEADRAHRAWEAARATQASRPHTSTIEARVSEAARGAVRGGVTGGVTAGAAGAAAAVASPVVRETARTAAAAEERERAADQLSRAARSHEATRTRLAQVRDQAVRLAEADRALALREGRAVRLADGRVVPTVRPGWHVIGNGHTVSPQVSAWIGEALDELYRSGFPQGPTDAEDLAIIVYNESGGNPVSVNTYDSNAAAGMPSFGLMQTIGPTFDRFAPPTRRDKADPVAQIMAGARYAQDVYQGLSQVPGVKSLRSGGPYRPY